MDYVQRVRAARGSLNLSLTDFAKRIGMGRSTLVRIENGTREPEASEYAAMAQVTGLPLNFFLVSDLDEAFTGPPATNTELDELRTDVRSLKAAVAALSADSLRHTQELQALRGTGRRAERRGDSA